MDFSLTEDQELLQESVRKFFEGECPPSLVRAQIGSADGFPRHLYSRMGELGFTGLTIPERHGGAALGMLELALLMEEAGRVALPGPLLSQVLSAIAIQEGGAAAQKARWLPQIARMESVISLVGFGDTCGQADDLTAKKVRSGWKLSGRQRLAVDAPVADAFLLRARAGKQSMIFLTVRDVPGLKADALELVDLTRRCGEVCLDDVVVPDDAVLVAAEREPKVSARVRDAACIVLAADSLGGAQRSLEMAVEYSKIRQQFGRPIGSFQAVKHMAAEMVADIEPSRALVWYAAYCYDRDPKAVGRTAAMAKARMSDVFSRVANRAVQIHGGIGFTWEHDMHFWFKRAKWNELVWGDATFHRERIAALSHW